MTTLQPRTAATSPDPTPTGEAALLALLLTPHPKACGRPTPCGGQTGPDAQTAPCAYAPGHQHPCKPRTLLTKYPPSLVATWDLTDALGWMEAEMVGVEHGERDNRELRRELITWERHAIGLAAIVRRLRKRPRTEREWETAALDWAQNTWAPGAGNPPTWTDTAADTPGGHDA